MIGRISGIILEKNPDQVLVDVGGVAYEIGIPLTTYERLGAIEESVVLHTHFVVREDAQSLFGFATERERELFRILIRVSGVGPRLAMTIQSGTGSETFVRWVRDNDVKALVAIPGIGRKTAERLILEVRDRLPDWELSDREVPESSMNQDNLADAEAALIGLGYRPQEASLALSLVDDTTLEVADLVRQALRKLSDV